MSAAETTLKMLLLGEDRSLSKTLKGAGDAADGVGKKMHGMGGLVKGLLAGAAGLAIVKFGKDSVDAFKNVGTATLSMQRRIGGTPESVSRLNFALHESGIEAETAQKGFGIFEKNLVTATASSKAGGDMVKNLGFEFRDAHGHVKPMADILPQVADRFAKMPAGAEKTALAMKLFGKSGADMLPFLNKGSAGIAELEAESDKLGHTLSGKDLDAIKENKKAHREWSAAVEGVKIQFGSQLLPILNEFMQFLVSKGIPAIAAFIAGMKNGTGPGGQLRDTLGQVHEVIVKVLTFLGGHIGTLTQFGSGLSGLMVVSKVTGAVSGLFKVLLANPLMAVITLVSMLALYLIHAYQTSETFRNIVNKAFEIVKLAAIGLALMAVKSFHFLLNVWLTVAGGIIDGAAWAFGWVPGLGPKLQGAARNFHTFKDKVNATLSQVETDLTVQLNTGAAKRAADSLANYVRTRNYSGTINLGGHVNPKLLAPGHARGGVNLPEGWAVVGEEGPELRYNPAGSTIIPARQTAEILSGRRSGLSGSSGGGGSDRPIIVQLVADGRVLQQILLKRKRDTGGLQLGLA